MNNLKENKSNAENNDIISKEQISSKKIFGIGLRNIKTAISATLCVVIYQCIDRNPTFACIGAVFGMDNSVPSSLKTGGNRLVGTIIGGLIGMLFYSMSLKLPHNFITQILLIFVGISFLIYMSQLLKCSNAIQAGSVVFFIVMLNTPEDQYLIYAINRIIDTAVGVIMSIVINWIHIKKICDKKNNQLG
ncbi:MAG: aromatic acid exporter family protein [Coprobacillus sp.]